MVKKKIKKPIDLLQSIWDMFMDGEDEWMI
jgi:hypothetical protein